MKSKHIKVIMCAYIAIMVIVNIIYFAMPKTNLARTTKIENPLVSIYGETKINGKELLTSLQENVSTGKYKVEKFEFAAPAGSMELLQSEFNYETFIERKADNDSKVEVLRYTSRIVMNDIDLTDEIKSPLITLDNSQLHVNYVKQEFKYVKFPKDFTITQFIKDKSEVENGHSGGGFGSIIIVRIPKDLNVIDDEKYQFINNK